MARVARSDHPKILHAVDVAGRKVAEVATEYGCTPATIYAILSRLRREAVATPEPAAVVASPPLVAETAAPDLFAPAPKNAVVAKPPAPAPAAPPAPLGKSMGRGGVGAKSAKPGFGLLIRTNEGEDALTPFRSLEDLLSAVKPILRTAARSPDTIWFAIQPIDLATIEIDAE